MKSSIDIAKEYLEKWFSTTTSENNTSQEDSNTTTLTNSELLEKFELYNTIDTDTAWQQLQNRLVDKEEQQPKVIRSLRPFIKYAAVFTGVTISIFFLFSDKPDNVLATDQLLALIDRKPDAVSLQIDNRIVEMSAKDRQFVTNDLGDTLAMRRGNELLYRNGKSNDQGQKHILTVPNGQTFRVILADGTKIHCDSDTSVEYASNFSSAQLRKVKLRGQAFFDVAKKKTKPFVVYTNDMDIEVLGTQFNVDAYPKRGAVQTVLLEGAIKVTKKDSEEILHLVPGQKATVGRATKKLMISTVNTYDYTAWISKKMVFNNVSFENILNSLERRFNVTIRNMNVEHNKKVFTAKFDHENLIEVLNAFAVDLGFEYRLEGETIVLE